MRMLSIKTFAGAIALLAITCLPAAAQSKNMTPQEQKNLKFVMDWWREGFVAGHPEAADKYLAPDLIQHNPNAPNGSAPIKAMLSRLKPMNPIPATIPADRMPAMAFGKGDYVVLIWERNGKDPVDPAKTYKWNDFDVFRLENGKIAEHWDGAMKNPPNGAGKE